MDTGEYDDEFAQELQAYNIQKENTMVYIQSDSERKLPHHFDAACALYGAIDSAVEVRLTSFEEVQSGKFNSLIKRNLFVGSTEFMFEVFSKHNKYTQLPNANRPYEIKTLKEIREIVANGGKKFIKPQLIKEFTGLVVDPFTISSMKSFSDDHKVLVYDVLPKILSEWRVYVFHHQMAYSSNYAGEFQLTPDYMYVNEVIRENKRIGFPVAYTIDIGICEGESVIEGYEMVQHNSNVVIEFNDMWAIGNYGLDNWRYYDMLRERYFEIMRSGHKTEIV